MGRLSDLFEHHRDNVEEGVKKALGRADDTLEALRKRVEDLEARLRDVAGEAPNRATVQKDQATDKDLNAQNAEGSHNVVTTNQTGTSRQTRSKK